MRQDGEQTTRGDLGRARRGRAPAAVVLISVAIVLDYLSFAYVIPWVDERYFSPFMSAGYILTFFIVLCNLIFAFAMLAYLLHRDSYPSDKWQ